MLKFLLSINIYEISVSIYHLPIIAFEILDSFVNDTGKQMLKS